jgi:hypothetical protein
MSEQKTAKVKEILQKRKWDGPNGTVFYYKLELDNGEIGEIGKKKDNAIHVGEPLTYTSEESDYGLKFKAVTQNGFSGGGFKGGQRGSSASFALSYAKDLTCSMVAAGKTQDLKAVQIAEATIIIACRFRDWLKENEN